MCILIITNYLASIFGQINADFFDEFNIRFLFQKLILALQPRVVVHQAIASPNELPRCLWIGMGVPG